MSKRGVYARVNIFGVIGVAFASIAAAQTIDITQKDASPATLAIQAQARASLPPDDGSDDALARRGFIGTAADPVIRRKDGQIVFDATQYDWIRGEAPATVNPALWRQQSHLRIHGLFKVAEGVWQVRGLSTSNLTVVRGDRGWIIIDTNASVEAAQQARVLIEKYLGKRPISAIIYSHSHPDHFAGTAAFVTEGDHVPIIAPLGFMEETIAEWGKIGASSTRRGNFIAGPHKAGPKDNVGMGIAASVDIGGTMSLIPPTDVIRKTGETRTIDGVTMEFQMVHDTEAPAEMNVFLPKQKTFYSAEITSCSTHNLQAPRGAQVRDGLAWANYITEIIERYGDRTEALPMGHCWPHFGSAAIKTYLGLQRDNYKFTHDQTVRLMNDGLSPTEIADTLKRPPALANDWSSRDFYGVLRHNVKGVFQRYTGWWSGIPADLNALPLEEESPRFVRAMGGAEPVMREAKRAMAEGDYRWAAEVLNHLVFAEPNNLPARSLLADTYEQMGYQSESAPWRNIYLWGAAELRGAKPYDVWAALPDVGGIIPTQKFLDTLGTLLVPEKIGERKLKIALELTDRHETALIDVHNAVLVGLRTDKIAPADARLRGTMSMVRDLFLKRSSLDASEKSGLQVSGDRGAVAALLESTELPKRHFPVVAPTIIDLGAAAN